MARNPHPFEQLPQAHAGWDRKHFELFKRTWSLLVIDREDEQSSMISEYNGSSHAQPWPFYHSLTIEGRVTVDGAVSIIERTFLAYEAGVIAGRKDAKSEIRRALGV